MNMLNRGKSVGVLNIHKRQELDHVPVTCFKSDFLILQKNLSLDIVKGFCVLESNSV